MYEYSCSYWLNFELNTRSIYSGTPGEDLQVLYCAEEHKRIIRSGKSDDI